MLGFADDFEKNEGIIVGDKDDIDGSPLAPWLMIMVELVAMDMMVMAVEMVVMMVVEMRMMMENVSPLVVSGGAVGVQSNNRSLINHSLLFRPITCETYACPPKLQRSKIENT